MNIHPYRWLSYVLVPLLLVVFAIDAEAQQRGVAPDTRLNMGPKPEAIADQVMVSTQLANATEAALEVLRTGGNAVDAMITAILLQHVEDYMQVSHWGTLSGIYYHAETGEYHAISAVAQVPRSGRCEVGQRPGQVAIGGVIRALGDLGERFGTRDWNAYVQPAIRSASDGVVVSSFLYGINAGMVDGMVAGSTYGIRGQGFANPEERAFFMPDGYLTPVGERWKMPALADHLRRLAAQGPDYMYGGEWGQKFVREANRRGHCVTLDDLRDYRVEWQDPVRFSYRGHQILGSPPPDEGGLEVGYNLNILENFDLPNMPHYTRSAETLEIMARTFGRTRDETRWAIQDPLTFRVPGELWLSAEYGRMGAEFVRNTMPRAGVDLTAFSADEALSDFASSAGSSSESNDETFAMGSNQNVIVDAEGNWFTVLHTGHGGAPGIFIDGVRAGGSRFSENAFGGGPGKRVVLPITSIIIERDGRPWLAMGTPGSPPQPVTQVLLSILDWNIHPKEAAEMPRFWAFRDHFRELEAESRLSQEVRQGLARSGLRIKEMGDYTWRTGSMQIIWRNPDTGRLHGVTDPRRLGWAAGF